ncbi:MAG TPA: pyrroline-5-carboxylate reductase [Rhizomicrobium sp.]|jgi:pyrroline-5-carboxylate reductase|nr:pyrroline-5-carboxylate reductase [Rhizomicrobium sp.]
MILLVGAGRMGQALLKGWIGQGIGPIAAMDPVPSSELKKFAKRGVKLSRALGDERPRVCVVALKPQILKTEMESLRGIAKHALMISIAAGTTTNSLARAWGRDARIVRAMPNTPGAIGRGITALYASKKVNAKDRALAEKLLAALGETLWVKKESLIDSVTAVSGSGPAYVFLLVEAMAEGAQREGLPRDVAMKLARATVVGSGALLDADKSSAANLRVAVTSPGGTTEAALKILMSDDGLASLMSRAISAARKRAEELGKT